jgi:uncharacterized membrane protein YkvA (DUF1232 family)
LKRIIALWRTVAGQDLRLLWYAVRHEHRPGWLVPALAGLALFAAEPLNVAVPLLGTIDEFVLLPLMLHGIANMLPAHVVDGYARAYDKRSRRRA